MRNSSLKIGCVSAFWGDTAEAVGQILRVPDLDFIVGDYLAEITMSLLAYAKLKDPKRGFIFDFVKAFAPHMQTIAERNIRVVVNAGGLNLTGCRDALRAAADDAGVKLRIATVEGDDLMPKLDEVRALEPREMYRAAPLPKRLLSMNAYIGARPIAEALDAGADVVITGRCNDGAVVLGPLMHAFEWRDDDYDLLAAGSLAGHLVECGTQCTGGLFTDWRDVPGWENMGFPVAECSADGDVVITKPADTGGLVTPATVGEQLVYEIGDPAAYILPDVVCDLRDVTMTQEGPDRVRVRGARGLPPTPTYKVSATYVDGFRLLGTLLIRGFEADAKAERVGEALIARARRLFADRGLADFDETSVEVVGAEAGYGAQRRDQSAREAVLKIAARHPNRDALALFGEEIVPAGTSMAQGITGIFGGRPKPVPVVRLFSFLVPRELVAVWVSLDDERWEPALAGGVPLDPPPARAPRAERAAAAPPSGATVEVPLRTLAWARSGDKGDKANIGVLARLPEYVPAIAAQVTPEAVKAYFAHLVEGEVERFQLPGMHGFNFLMHEALGGGGIASLRYDPQGKGLAQMLLDLPVRVPASWARGGQ